MRCQHRTYKVGNKCKATIRLHPDNIRFIDVKEWHSCPKQVRRVDPREEVKETLTHPLVRSSGETPSLVGVLQPLNGNVQLSMEGVSKVAPVVVLKSPRNVVRCD